jgi:hypothetical protein
VLNNLILITLVVSLISVPLMAQTFNPGVTIGAGIAVANGIPFVTDDIFDGWETSTDGTQVTQTILAADSHGGNGAWSIVQDATGVLTISTSCEKQLRTQRVVSGSTYDGSGTRGLLMNEYLGVAGYTIRRSFTTTSTAVSFGHWIYTNLPTTLSGIYSLGDLHAGVSNGDFVNILIGKQGFIYPEVILNPNGPDDYAAGPSCNYAPGVGNATYGFFPYQVNTWYWVTAQFNEYVDGTTMHFVQVYDTSGNLLCTEGKFASSVNPHVATEWLMGRGGEGAGTSPGQTTCYDNFVMDYTTGALQIP